MTNKAMDYAYGVAHGKIDAPKYVRLQCGQMTEVMSGQNETYIFQEQRFHKICKIFRMLRMAKGPKAGETLYASLCGYQWLIVASLCVVHRADPSRRRYRKFLLEIARKNAKTTTVAIVFLICFFLEPEYSKFYSVAPNGDLAKEIKDALEPLLAVNAGVFEKGEFKVRRDYILHEINNIKYIPLNFSRSTMDAKEPSVFIADEIGALPTNYPIEAMRSGQILVKNPIGFLISTKYPTVDNPLEDEVADCKRVLDGMKRDDEVFALLYEPDEIKDWQTDDRILRQANPLASEIESVWEYVKKKRQDAIDREKLRENFLTKHCNIIYQGTGTESFIDVREVQKCRVDHIDWSGREVYLGVDLSLTNDNTSVAMIANDNGDIIAEVFCFIPEGRIDEKNAYEKINYREYIDTGKCIACGDQIIDYAVIEDFVFGIEQRYDVTVLQIAVDPWNARNTSQRWDEVYDVVEVKQHSSVLHPATKALYEKIMEGEFRYEKNPLLEINFQNAKCDFDTNMNRYVHKKRSKGKVDMVMALINAVHLMEIDSLSHRGFVIQTMRV